MKFRIAKIYPRRVLCYCNWHEEKNPSLNISLVEPYYGNYKCFGCGVRGKLSLKEMKGLGLEMKKKKRDKPINIDWGSLGKAYYHSAVNSRIITVLSNKWGVLYNSIDVFNCGWDGESFTFPMRNQAGQVIGIQRRFLEGKKCCVEGSQLGLFIPLFHDIPPESIFITEGVSDAAAVYDLGFDAIGRPSCNSCEGMIVDWLNANECIETVIIIPDNDLVGQGGAKLLADLICTNTEKDVDVFEFNDKCKDIREYIQKVGKERVRRELNEYI
jgi:DNA primase